MNEHPNPEQIKMYLAAEIGRLVNEQNLNDAEAGAKGELTTAELARLRAGEFSNLSIDRLIDILNKFNRRVTVSIAAALEPATDSRPIWQKIEGIMADVPPQEWEKVPTDLSQNLDHYLYGASKRD